MRDLQVETISFTDSAGKSHAIKDMTEYSDKALAATIPVQKYDRIDEIVTRREIYGDDSEEDINRVIEMNIEDIFESRFDLTKIKELRIPIR